MEYKFLNVCAASDLSHKRYTQQTLVRSSTKEINDHLLDMYEHKKDPRCHYELMQKVLKPDRVVEEEKHVYAWLIDKQHNEKNLCCKIGMETNVLSTGNSDVLPYNAKAYFFVFWWGKSHRQPFEIDYSRKNPIQSSKDPNTSLALPILLLEVQS